MISLNTLMFQFIHVNGNSLDSCAAMVSNKQQNKLKIHTSYNVYIYSAWLKWIKQTVRCLPH